MDELSHELNWGEYRLSKFDSQRLGPGSWLRGDPVWPVPSESPHRDGRRPKWEFMARTPGNGRSRGVATM